MKMVFPRTGAFSLYVKAKNIEWPLLYRVGDISGANRPRDALSGVAPINGDIWRFAAPSVCLAALMGKVLLPPLF
jgi:hypothetical protein